MRKIFLNILVLIGLGLTVYGLMSFESRIIHNDMFESDPALLRYYYSQSNKILAVLGVVMASTGLLLRGNRN